MDKGKVQDFNFYSKELDENINILVYLPPQYTPLYKYSYCIAQDGKDYFQLGRIARTLDELISNGDIEPILFFGIPYQNVEDRRQKYHPQGTKHNQYKRFLTNELLTFIENEYSVLHMGQSRALAGDSLAATVSLLTALDYPHTFGKLLLHSPYVNDLILERAHKFEDWQLLSIYHCIGKQEDVVQMTDGSTGDFLTPNRQLKEIIQVKTSSYVYHEFDGNHTWKYWQEDLKMALISMFS